MTTTKECTVCDGVGYLTEVPHDDEQERIPFRRVECEACDGTGVIEIDTEGT